MVYEPRGEVLGFSELAGTFCFKGLFIYVSNRLEDFDIRDCNQLAPS
jgi:hypothetical protein